MTPTPPRQQNCFYPSCDSLVSQRRAPNAILSNQFQDFVLIGPGFLKQAGGLQTPSPPQQNTPLRSASGTLPSPANEMKSANQENSGRQQKLLKPGFPPRAGNKDGPSAGDDGGGGRGSKPDFCRRKTTICRKLPAEKSAGEFSGNGTLR